MHFQGTTKSIDETDQKDYGTFDVVAQPQEVTGYRKWLTLVGLAFGNFSIGACVSLQAPFFPAEAEHKGATAAQYGFVFAVYQLGIFLFAPIFGKMVGFVPPFILSVLGITVVAISSILFGQLDGVSESSFIPLAITIRLVEGIGAVAVKTASYAIIGTTFPEKIATIFGSLETCLGIGLIVGPTIGGALYQLGGFPTPFVVLGILLIIDACIMLAVLPRERSRIERSAELLRFCLHPTTVFNALSVVSVFLYLGFYQVSLEPHLRKFNLSPFLIGCIFVISGGIYAICAPLWGRLCDKGVNPRILVLVGTLVSLTSQIIIGPVGFIPVETQLWMVLLGLALMGFGLSLKLVSTFIISIRETASRGFPNDMTTYALVSTLFATSQSVGAFVGPTSSGLLLDHYGFRWAVLFVISVELLLLVCVLLQLLVINCFPPTSSQILLPEKSVFETSYTKSIT